MALRRASTASVSPSIDQIAREEQRVAVIGAMHQPEQRRQRAGDSRVPGAASLAPHGFETRGARHAARGRNSDRQIGRVDQKNLVRLFAEPREQRRMASASLRASRAPASDSGESGANAQRGGADGGKQGDSRESSTMRLINQMRERAL